VWSHWRCRRSKLTCTPTRQPNMAMFCREGLLTTTTQRSRRTTYATCARALCSVTTSARPFRRKFWRPSGSTTSSSDLRPLEAYVVPTIVLSVPSKPEGLLGIVRAQDPNVKRAWENSFEPAVLGAHVDKRRAPAETAQTVAVVAK
jgi:hypothetical protein